MMRRLVADNQGTIQAVTVIEKRLEAQQAYGTSKGAHNKVSENLH